MLRWTYTAEKVKNQKISKKVSLVYLLSIIALLTLAKVTSFKIFISAIK